MIQIARCSPQLSALGLMVFVSLMISGCQGGKADGPKRFNLEGTVTLNGETVQAGSIIFEPDAGKGNNGPGSAVDIVKGRYKTAKDQGVVGGPYVLRITGYDGVPIMTGEGTSTLGKQLFTEKVLQIELPFSNSTFEVKVPEK